MTLLEPDTAPPRTADLLRVATAGSVDDGKSTLIGRLLLDAKQVLEDQLEAVERTSARRGDAHLDLALLTDGLRAEREQGITIDVAYRYFTTARRRFILADTPGHEQYTRNMVTGASTADLAIVLIDARKGVGAQSKRHAYVSAMLGIPHLVVCVNKMDLVGHDEQVFRAIEADFRGFAEQLGVPELTFVPISALHGDNVVNASESTPWYTGPPLLRLLEEVSVVSSRNLEDVRFPVQAVIRPVGSDYRGYAGQVVGGVLEPGDEVAVLPSGRRSRIAAIDTYDGPLERAFPPMAVTVRLENEVDASRGDMLVGTADPPEPAREHDALVCWMADAPLRPGARLALKHTTRAARAIVDEVRARVDVETLEPVPAPDGLALNDIGTVRLRTSSPLVVDPYRRNRSTGSFILIDEATNATVAAGTILGPAGGTP